MDSRNNNTPPEGQGALTSSSSDVQSQQVTDILQKNGYENLEAFLSKNPQQRHLLQEDGDLAFYHPFKVAEKLTLFFANKDEPKNPALFKVPSFKARR